MKSCRVSVKRIVWALVSFAVVTAVCTALWAQQPASPVAADSKAPAIVFIIRHAEKPMDDKDAHLTAQGYKRAQALPALFLQRPGSTELPRLPRPSVLFASAPSKHSNRPIETITPLAQALRLRVNTSYEDRETTAVANELLSGKYAGKVVLICWHHGEIPHLARALGVDDAPKKWDDTVFDQMWMLEWVDGKPQFSTLPERLLPGDSAK